MKKAILFQVKSSQEKIPFIYNVAKKQFDLGHRLLIRTPDQKASEYINTILWSTPKESFLPHQIALEPCEELICITYLPVNVNSANVCLNLTQNAIIDGSFHLIYDFEMKDQNASSSLKIKEYREALFSIASF